MWAGVAMVAALLASLCVAGTAYGRGRTSLVDAVIVTKVEGATGNSSTCTFGVDKSAGTNCPLLYALLARTPAGSEQYWP